MQEHLNDHLQKENASSFKEICKHERIMNNKFCLLCGCIANNFFMCSKHPKYIYKIEIDPNQIFQSMISTISTNNKYSLLSLSTTYISIRKEIISKIKKISHKLGFKSQTFFLAIEYLDSIFLSDEMILSTASNMMLYSLACLVIAAKFEENDSTIPNLPTFVEYYNAYTRNMINVDILREAEVNCVIKLKYKLNRYSTYHYISFLFCHGIIIKEEKARKILEKIYVKARDILDKFVLCDFYVKYYDDTLSISFAILSMAINEILKGKCILGEIVKEVFNVDLGKKTIILSIEKDISGIIGYNQEEKVNKLQCSLSSGKLINQPNTTKHEEANYYNKRRALSSFKREIVIEKPKQKINFNQYKIENFNNIYNKNHQNELCNDLLYKTKNIFSKNEKTNIRETKPSTIIINNFNINIQNPESIIQEYTARSSYRYLNYRNNLSSKYPKSYNFY